MGWSRSSTMQKPKNYSRKNSICSCECPIRLDGKTIDKFMIKYEIEPDKSIKKIIPNIKSNYGIKYWATGTNTYWGKFKKVVELPEVLNKMENDEYLIKTGHFTRDNIEVPFVYEIEILNIQKYNTTKIQLERNKKIKNLNK